MIPPVPRAAKPFIACFDSATAVGACDGVVGCAKPRCWTWDLRKGGKERPQRLLHLSRELGAYYRANRVDLAYVEAPLPIAVMMNIGSNDETVQMLRGVVAIIETVSARAGVPIAWWDVQAARQAVTGRRTYPKGTAKIEVMKHCRMLGYTPADENQADALVGFLYQSALLNPRLAHLTTPLFGAAHAR